MPGGLAPDPGQVGDRGMREDDRGARVDARERERVRPSDGIPRPACTMTGSRRSSAKAKISRDPGSPRPNRSARGCSLIPAAPRPTARSASREPRRVRIDAAERDQPALRGLGRGEHAVVGCPVAARLGEREHDRARRRRPRARPQLGGAEAGPVGIGAAQVRVASKSRMSAESVLQAREPRLEQRVGSHSSHERRRDSLRRPDAARPWAGEDVSDLIADVGAGRARGHP